MANNNQNSLKCLPRWHRLTGLLNFIYILCTLLLLGAIGTFLLSDFIPPIPLPPWLDGIIKRDAVVAVINTVGVTAIVIAWLINITDQTICKERIGVLINWAYPGFFLFYFTIFLMTVLCGVYMGNASQRRLPILLVAAGITLGVALIARVSYIFLFSYEKRNQIAFTFHELQLKDTHDANTSYTRQRIMIQAASITAEREENCEEIHADEIYELWKTCVTTCCKKGESSREGDNPIGMSHDYCRLAERFWESLIPKAGVPYQQETFLNLLVSENIDRTSSEEDDSICYNHLLAGFLFMLARKHDVEDHSWEFAYQVLTDLFLEIQDNEFQCGLSFMKLFWGLALIMGIESAFNHPAQFDLCLELSNRLHVKEFLKRANLLDEANMLDKNNTGKNFPPVKDTDTQARKQAEKIKTFLAGLRCVFLREFGYGGGIYVEGQKVSYKDQMKGFLNEGASELYTKDPTDDMAVVCWLLRKEP